MNLDEIFMRLALDEAWKYQLLTYPNPAVGAVIVQNGRILAVQAHQKAGTSHAEVIALLYAYEVLSSKRIVFDRFDAHKAHDFLLSLPKNFFSECTIYVTLEPCSHTGKTPSCASLLQKLSPKRVVIGLKDPITGHNNGAKMLKSVTLGVLEDACRDLLEPFLIWQKRAFVLFKLAQTTNGRIGGGYLSSQASLYHVHQLREVCSTLMIGGNTVRIDRPILDCRFTQGRAPNVTIYSKKKKFDETIPLFGVNRRSVTVTEELDWLTEPSFVLVEGGERMLKALKDHIDWMLIYQTPKLSTHELSYNIDMNLAFLHQDKKDADIMIWSRQVGH
ncbi:bifunctional diaminohydroxyphosphoribosylaminopyrimidine deaminase/5-amino-6-(5-phosphoribosylamino)uracil reductase RibD [Sulfurovum sp. ST-21]|uniref:Riboflavin biosynthesis protein RibD n=1 Tax=Sulfurovum indicum TaxID=2779528 RepID=A0A7M1S4I1_9BACT|nr:bifunctional diaminohydroxyphosphoribosylaminopyrimidine deaminase/5-amino-6-(5-phosphoribosylamino)uracil reductase RibD [Sulfurovum indicum]QOR62313.1 bifunctional diaminohydroxyphosphoribosylaminopyrimidine deaminase/5-amino-6-(5-phosphoribosylamino)uracil reductase RibD [Sulfurovum indicum]